jgi:2-polyprenyl-3-methyl-5-hydroxy-6-metoxy-1,4-benzoquinol methylase
MLKTRAIAEELMDADDLAPETYSHVVHDLARVNTLTLARRPTLAFLESVRRAQLAGRLRAMAAANPGSKVHARRTTLKILDVGFGDGDMLRTIHRWAEAHSVDATLVGIDLNPRSARAAAEATPEGVAIEWRTGDYADCAGEGWDIVISSLVAHHMTHEQLIGFLRFMDREAAAGWFVNDLHRHGFAWTGFPLLASLMRWHPIVRHDGQLSIARSYRPAEWAPILAEAGIEGAEVRRVFPFRLCVSKRR